MSLSKTIQSWGDKLKKMQSEPASKEWFAKHGTPKANALKKMSKEELKAKFIARHGGVNAMHENANKVRGEIHKHSGKTYSEKEKSDYQHRTGRGYHE